MSLRAAFDSPERKRAHNRALFTTIADRYDLITAVLSYGQDARWKRTLIAKAQLERGERVLVHGSLKLASNPWDGAAVSGCGLSFARAAEVMTEAFAAALGQVLTPSEWTADELAARERIRAVRYGNKEWVTERRGPRP